MHTYLGSGPYCYANSLAMMLGRAAPPVGVIETLTGSPFGMQLLGGRTPFFDPYGWDPELGVDTALELLGWTCERSHGGTEAEALARLRAAGPAMAGPLDMALLPYAPGGGGDHYVVVLAVEGDTVVLHDPHGHPYATLSTGEFLAAWRGEAVAYLTTPYALRGGFARVRETSVPEALRAALPAAARWLEGRDDLPVPPGTLGGADAALRLAELVEQGLDEGVRGLLTHFGVRVGARRLADAAGCLDSLGLAEAAAVLAGQARELGGLQHPLVTGDDRAVAAGLRRLAPAYRRLPALLR
ncbi:hypothetical protein [Nonomuraea zeae]|uniref:Uncharacterized protein n=1 Tax=Nonomuraea zeae TaxID=1642303 RepID=A0A5S4GJK0_9ACTN|nr:hypothetical protein [Nonomuraea zeae]TMR32751.1 hypothetical protein ETD85_21805 [Nonomuraea zeae]